MNAVAQRSSRAETTDRPVAVVAAMPMELRPLLARTTIQARERIGEARVHRGRLGQRSVLLICTGDGQVQAERGLRSVLETTEVLGLVVIGVSGGLSPTLMPGSLIVAREVRDQSGTLPPPDGDWVAEALLSPLTEVGTVLSSERILCTAADKRLAWSTLDHDSAALVDLESAAYARVASDSGVPYLVVRTVSDTAEEDLPLDLNRCRDSGGRVVPGRVVRRTLLRPAAMRELWQLRRRVIEGSQSLAGYVERLLNGGWS